MYTVWSFEGSPPQFLVLLNSIMQLPTTTTDLFIDIVFPNTSRRPLDHRLSNGMLAEAWADVDASLSTHKDLRIVFGMPDVDNSDRNWVQECEVLRLLLPRLYASGMLQIEAPSNFGGSLCTHAFSIVDDI